MPRVAIGPALPDRDQLDAEIARLRDLDVNELRGRWQTAFGRPAPAHLGRHLLFRMVAYQLQAERFGDLDAQSRRCLDRSDTPQTAGRSAGRLNRPTSSIRPVCLECGGSRVLGREALDQPSRFGTRERRAVKVEVILDEQDDLDTREAGYRQTPSRRTRSRKKIAVAPRNAVNPPGRPRAPATQQALLPVPAKKWGAYCTGRPRIWCCWDHSAGRAVRRVMPIP